jgi:cytochrome c oxidase assembly factor CtaG
LVKWTALYRKPDDNAAFERWRLMSWRRRVTVSARVSGLVVIIAATTGKLPHLVATQAAISAFLTMVVAPLWLLDRTEKARAPGARWSLPAFPAITLIAAGTIAVQLPAAVSILSEGGPVTALALSGLLLGAVAFWSVVMPPARLRGLAACGYVVIGGVPISLPAMFLIFSQRDLYAGFHATTAPAIGAINDQLIAGFILFAAVKLAIWVVGSCVFFAAAGEAASADDDDGGRPVPVPPKLPGWVMGLAGDAPTVEEPKPAPARILG